VGSTPQGAGNEPPRYARVVVEVSPAHLDRPFDYRIAPGAEVVPGQRVRVDFAGRRRTGWVVEIGAAPATDPARIRDLHTVDGAVVWFDEADLRLYRWVARRYAATLADVLRHAMPPRVAAVEREAARLAAPPPARATGAARPPCPSPVWRPYDASALLRDCAAAQLPAPPLAFYLRELPGDDRAALVADLVSRCLSAGRRALILAADPASPVPAAALQVAGSEGVDLRTDVPRDRYRAFLRLRDGRARVAVGERAAALVPVADLGLVVVDDEANPAHKERRSPRHHVREVALARARMVGATAVLLGDLPSAAAWRLLEDSHLQPVSGDRQLERQRAPRVEVVDLSDPRPGTRRARFAGASARRLSEVVAAGGAAVVLAARGGQGAAHVCRGCGRRHICPVCESSLRPQPDAGEDSGGGQGPGWWCPACEWDTPTRACPDCGEVRTSPLAAGAGRLAQELARSHPQAEVVRMEGFDAAGPERRPAIAVMTRGSVVARPAWLRDGSADLVVVPDADAMLGRAALDAAEDALRLWFAVARWAGSGARLMLQTKDPGDPAVQALVRWDPDGWWRREAPRRAELHWPPERSLVRLAVRGDGAREVGAQVRAALPADDEVLGPDLDGALIVKSADLRGTLGALTALRHAWGKANRGVRVDVDPV